MPTESENTVNARLLKLEIEARQDRQTLRDHLVAAEQATRDAAAQRSGDFDRHRIERQADMEKAERERDQIKALIESNKRLIEDNTRAIHDANIAGKILVKLAAIVVGAPVTVYGIIKVVQELFPPRAPLHAVAFYLVLSAIIFSALPALSATYSVDLAENVCHDCNSFVASPATNGPASRGVFFLESLDASLGSDPGGQGRVDPD